VSSAFVRIDVGRDGRGRGDIWEGDAAVPDECGSTVPGTPPGLLPSACEFKAMRRRSPWPDLRSAAGRSSRPARRSPRRRRLRCCVAGRRRGASAHEPAVPGDFPPRPSLLGFRHRLPHPGYRECFERLRQLIGQASQRQRDSGRHGRCIGRGRGHRGRSFCWSCARPVAVCTAGAPALSSFRRPQRSAVQTDRATDGTNVLTAAYEFETNAETFS
jgi:hypothetical protein